MPGEWPWLWREMRPFLRYQIAGLLIMLVAGACGLVGPLLVKWLIDDVLPNGRWGTLAFATALFFVTHVARMTLWSVGGLVNLVAVQRLSVRVRQRLLKRLLALSPGVHGRYPVGDLVQRLEHDVTYVSDSGTDLVPAVVRMVIDVTLTAGAMIFLDWRLALVILPLLPLFAYVRHRYRATLQRSADEVREAAAAQSSLLNESLGGISQIQLLGAEARFARRYVRLQLRTVRSQFRQRRHELAFLLITMTAVGLGSAVIIGYGGVRVMSQTLTPGTLVAFYSYLGNIFAPMSTGVELYTRLSRVRASIRRLLEIEQAPSCLTEDADAAPLTPSPMHVACRQLSFAYTAGQETLWHVDFEAHAGERVVIVGQSGGGKSSLANLISRLYDPTEGSVTIDGRDLRALPLRSLRRAISYVPQDPVLFQGTLRDNLRHAHPGATDQEMAAAAWTACLTPVVERLPNGWDTRLGPAGSGLSGGERQRLALARALLQRRPIVILDESTSALDAPEEHRLLSRLKEACAQRILIAVSHRLAAARWATRVIVMSDGQVLEEGTHASLYREGTRYYALWHHADEPQASSV